MTMTDEKMIGSDSFEVKRDTKMPNIGPGHIQYGHGQRFANDRNAGGNLPFTQQIAEDTPAEPGR